MQQILCQTNLKNTQTLSYKWLIVKLRLCWMLSKPENHKHPLSSDIIECAERTFNGRPVIAVANGTTQRNMQMSHFVQSVYRWDVNTSYRNISRRRRRRKMRWLPERDKDPSNGVNRGGRGGEDGEEEEGPIDRRTMVRALPSFPLTLCLTRFCYFFRIYTGGLRAMRGAEEAEGRVVRRSYRQPMAARLSLPGLLWDGNILSGQTPVRIRPVC